MESSNLSALPACIVLSQLQMLCLQPVAPAPESGKETSSSDNLRRLLAWDAKYGHSGALCDTLGIFPA